MHNDIAGQEMSDLLFAQQSFMGKWWIACIESDVLRRIDIEFLPQCFLGVDCRQHAGAFLHEFFGNFCYGSVGALFGCCTDAATHGMVVASTWTRGLSCLC